MAMTYTLNHKHVSPRGWLVLVLFALPFAGVGLVFLFAAIVPTLFDGWRMQSWRPVHATLMDAALLTNRPGKGKVTYGVSATYQYELGGVRHTGTRPAINGGADDVAHFNYSLGKRLERAHQAREPVTAYVDPGNPSDSVLDRSIRWPLLRVWSLFVVAFGGVGFGLMGWAWRNYRRGSRGEDLYSATASGRVHGIAPEDAAHGEVDPISSLQKLETRLLTGFAAAALAMSIWMCLQVLPGAWNGRPAASIVLVFPLITLGLLRALYKRRRMRLRFGDAQLVLSPAPVRLGAPFAAHVDIRAPLRKNMRYSARLLCLHSRSVRMGDERHETEDLQWSASARAQVQSQGPGTVRLQWRLQVPPGLPTSEAPGVRWRLEIHDEDDAQGYRAQFQMPVLAAGEGAPVQADVDADADDGTQALVNDEGLLPGTDPLAAVCSLQPLPGGGLRLAQPAGRMWRAQRILVLTGLLIGLPLFLAIAAAAPLPLRVGASLAVAMLVAWAVFAVGNRRTTTLSLQQGIRMERHLLGLRISFTQRPAADVEQLAIRLAYTQSLGNRPSEKVYTLYAQLRGGRTLTLADSLSGGPAAHQALRHVALHSGFLAAVHPGQ
ncbi:MAG: DUF3592 domain-containing protein [Comamonadaceae bacterium]|nr:MAG: DUF3592 domain-containing protein [Comamonadaceae bacterium]